MAYQPIIRWKSAQEQTGEEALSEAAAADIHPKAVNGVLLELIDYKWTELQGK